MCRVGSLGQARKERSQRHGCAHLIWREAHEDVNPPRVAERTSPSGIPCASCPPACSSDDGPTRLRSPPTTVSQGRLPANPGGVQAAGHRCGSLRPLRERSARQPTDLRSGRWRPSPALARLVLIRPCGRSGHPADHEALTALVMQVLNSPSSPTRREATGLGVPHRRHPSGSMQGKPEVSGLAASRFGGSS